MAAHPRSEDDLPRWALPMSYTAGISVGATDLRREGCHQAARPVGLLHRALQDGLRQLRRRRRPGGRELAEHARGWRVRGPTLGRGKKLRPRAAAATGERPTSAGPRRRPASSLSSASSTARPSADVCQIRLRSVHNGPNKDVETFVQFCKSPRYPGRLTMAVIGALPAYIKLSVIKKAVAYMAESLQGEDMKIYFVADWIQQNITTLSSAPAFSAKSRPWRRQHPNPRPRGLPGGLGRRERPSPSAGSRMTGAARTGFAGRKTRRSRRWWPSARSCRPGCYETPSYRRSRTTR